MKYILFLLVTFLLFSCKENKETIVTEVPVMRASAIYFDDSVYHYMERTGEKNKEMAESYFEKGKKEEEINSDKAIYCLKRAITLNPSLSYYKELGALLNAKGNYLEAVDLYRLLIYKAYIYNQKSRETTEEKYLFGEPEEDVYYEYLVNLLAQNHSLYGEDIYTGRDLKFDMIKIKEKLFTDKRINININAPETKNMLLLFLSPEELAAYNKLEGAYKNFLVSIKDVSPVFEIDKNTVRDFKYDEFNGRWSYDYNDRQVSYVFSNNLIEKKQDSTKWYEYNFNHLVIINENVNAVIYAIDSSATACPVDMRHIYHRLVTYDKNGDPIDNKIVAMQEGQQLQTLNFNNGKFTITTFKRNWKNPYNKNDFDNYLVSTEKLGEESYVILPDGKIKLSGSSI